MPATGKTYYRSQFSGPLALKPFGHAMLWAHGMQGTNLRRPP